MQPQKPLNCFQCTFSLWVEAPDPEPTGSQGKGPISRGFWATPLVRFLNKALYQARGNELKWSVWVQTFFKLKIKVMLVFTACSPDTGRCSCTQSVSLWHQSSIHFKGTVVEACTLMTLSEIASEILVCNRSNILWHFLNIFSAIYVEKSACCKSVEPNTSCEVTVCCRNSVGVVQQGWLWPAYKDFFFSFVRNCKSKLIRRKSSF